MTRPLLLLSFIMMSMSAWAENAAIKYIECSWDGEKVEKTEKTITDYTELPLGDHDDEWYGLGANDGKDHYYVVKKGTVEYETFNVFGRVHLILCDNAWLTCNGGILVQTKDGNDPHLMIYSQRSDDVEGGAQEGRLVVTNSNRNCAGIGSSEASSSGKITIHGGVIDATGADYGAGIGSGSCTSDVITSVGDITVYGGRVTGKGGDSGAGIGAGGSFYHQHSRGGNFYMYGGMVSVKGGGWDAAGLGGGGGYCYWLANKYPGGHGGKVYVYGGSLTADGTSFGAGIGSGWGGEGMFREYLDAGEVHISGGKVKATGYEGAGIGGGTSCYGAKVYISGGEVEAYSKTGAGIGSGRNDYDRTGNYIEDGELKGIKGGELVVTGGTVKAEGVSGAGIGGGFKAAGAKVTITGGTVEAWNGKYNHDVEPDEKTPSAIGTGERGVYIADNIPDRSLRVGSLTISDGLMVTSGYNDNDKKIIPAANRVSDCYDHYYAKIEACPHTAQNRDDASSVITYTINDDDTHTSHCRYCNHTETSEHSYVDGVCVCGAKESVSSVVAINVYTSTDGLNYTSQTDKVAKGSSYVLPKPADVTGLNFMGYLAATSKLSDIEMLDDDMSNTNSLLDAGQTITPTANVDYYARYRYTYYDDWTWAPDYSSATAKITWIHSNSNETLELPEEGKSFSIYPEDPNPDENGYYSYTATYAYVKSTGINYNFSNKITGLVSLALADGSDNTVVLNENNGIKVNTLTLSGRTLYKDDSWNTLCLPFSLSSLTGTPLEGADVRKLESSSFANGTLTLNFSTSSLDAIEAGKPYLVKWAKAVDVTNPAFNNVVLSVTDAGFVESKYVGFMGSFSPVSLEANDKTVLYLGEGNTLYYPSAAMTIGACRAYFKLADGITAGDLSKNIRAFVLNFDEESETTGISTISVDAASVAGWYTLDGRRLINAPFLPGLYIHNGHKVLLK